MLRSALLLFAAVLAVTASSAQPAAVKQYVQQVAAGWTTDAKKALPDLLIEYPDDPGVLFLHAALVDDNKKSETFGCRIFDVEKNRYGRTGQTILDIGRTGLFKVGEYMDA